MGSKKKEAKVRPTAKVSGLGKPTLTGRKLKASWKVPNALKGDSNAGRATHFFVWWTATYIDGKGKKKTKELVSRKKKGKTLHYADVLPDKTYHTIILDRGVWYPKTVTVGKKKKKEKRKLLSVTVTVAAYNGGGVALAKHRAKATYTFHEPDEPVLSASFNRSTGKATFTSTLKVAAGPRERYDIVGWVDRMDNLPGTQYKTFKRVIAFSACGSDKDAWTKSLNLGSVNSFTYDQYICLRFRSFCRGYRGDSHHSKSTPGKNGKTVKKNVRDKETTIYICYPPLATITSIQCVPDKKKVWDKKQKKYVDNVMSYNGRITISLKTNASKSRPVDSVQLEILKNSDAKTAQEAFGSDGWQKVEGMADNNKCTALTDTYANAYPDAGKHVWYRILSVHNEFERYSDAVEATALYHAPDTAVSDVFLVDAKLVKENASVASNTPTPAGVHVIYGLNDKAHRTGTETAWSQTLFSAVSTNAPEAFKNTSLVSTDTAKKWNNSYKKNYNYYGHVYVTGLEEGGKYYFAARNYRELPDTGTVKYGKYSYFAKDKNAASVLFSLPPKNVQLIVPSSVTYGKSFIVSWSFDSNVQQTHYTLKYVVPQRDSEGNIVYKSAGSNDAVTVENALRARTASTTNATVITADELKKAVYVDKDKRNRLCLRVSVETGGDPVTSSNAEASVYYTPNCKAKFQSEDYAETSAILTAQPLSVYYEHTNAKYVMFTVKSEGIVDPRPLPDGEVVQVDGDVLYTGTLPVTGDGSGVMTFPATLELIDGGVYTVDVRAKGPSGLLSPTRTIKFRVDWTHKAAPPNPTESLAVGSIETMSALIRPIQPDNWVKGDVCDIYRVTPDGVYQIASGVPFGSRVTDRFAPYSKTAILRYRLATRTADGDIEWVDIGYNIDGYTLRFDWGGNNTLVLPYNLKYSDSYTKDFLSEAHMDGTRTGWWNEGVERKATLSTDIVKVGDPEQKERIKALAVYSGPVFVRTPNGCAYTANVDVTNYDTSYDSLVVPVSFSATEIDLTDEFRVSTADIS